MRIRRNRATFAAPVVERDELAGSVFAAREEIGLRQEELAGWSAASVRDLEQAKLILRLQKVSDALNVLGVRLQIVDSTTPGVGIDAEARTRLERMRGRGMICVSPSLDRSRRSRWCPSVFGAYELPATIRTYDRFRSVIR